MYCHRWSVGAHFCIRCCLSLMCKELQKTFSFINIILSLQLQISPSPIPWHWMISHHSNLTSRIYGVSINIYKKITYCHWFQILKWLPLTPALYCKSAETLTNSHLLLQPQTHHYYRPKHPTIYNSCLRYRSSYPLPGYYVINISKPFRKDKKNNTCTSNETVEYYLIIKWNENLLYILYFM